MAQAHKNSRVLGVPLGALVPYLVPTGASLAMLTIVLLTLHAVVGITFPVALIILIASIAGAALLTIALTRPLSRKIYSKIDTFDEVKKDIQELIDYLKTHPTTDASAKINDQHRQAIIDLNKVLAEMNVGYVYLLMRFVSNLKLPLIKVGELLGLGATYLQKLPFVDAKLQKIPTYAPQFALRQRLNPPNTKPVPQEPPVEAVTALEPIQKRQLQQLKQRQSVPGSQGIPSCTD